MKLDRRAGGSLVFFLLVSAAAAGAEFSDEARGWLEKMSHAAQTLNYDGVFVYLHDGRLEAMRIVHRRDGRGERERLLSLNGTAREVIRDNHSIACILPDSKSVVVDKSRPKKLFSSPLAGQNIPALEGYYTLSLGERNRIAGHAAQIVLVKPKDEYRYGYRLWIGADSGLMLKSDMVDGTGNAVEQIMFTQINVRSEIPDADLEPAISGKEFTWFMDPGERSAPMPGDGQWQVMRLPAGFVLTQHRKHHLPASDMPVEHMVYTDGLATVSVYIEQVDSGKDLLGGISRMGAVNAYGRIIDEHQITVVGEVPQATVKLIGESVARIND